MSDADFGAPEQGDYGQFDLNGNPIPTQNSVLPPQAAPPPVADPPVAQVEWNQAPANRYNPNPPPVQNRPYGAASDPAGNAGMSGPVPPAARPFAQQPPLSPYGHPDAGQQPSYRAGPYGPAGGAPQPPGPYGQSAANGQMGTYGQGAPQAPYGSVAGAPIVPAQYGQSTASQPSPYGQAPVGAAYPPPYGYPGMPPGSVAPAAGAYSPSGLARPRAAITGWIFALIGTVAAVALLFMFARMAVPPKVVIPTVYNQYTPPDGTFACLAPGGWAVEGFGTSGGTQGGAEFKSGLAKISITDSQMMSFAVGPDSDTPALKGLITPAAQRLHDTMYPQVAQKYSDYNENDEQVYQSKIGDARISEFTANGGRLHGYRVSMVGLQTDIEVVCECPATDWDAVKPVFDKVLSSIGAAQQ